jgi:hypothetical protein
MVGKYRRKIEKQDQHLLSKENKMTNGVVIHLDNDLKTILEPSKNLFDQNDLDLDYLICETKESFAELIKENKTKIKALIFDLLSSEPTSSEIHESDAEFIESINNSYSNYNIPIFVYSGYLQALDGKYENSGTFFKVDKGDGIEKIFSKISKFYKSGFIDVFSPNGLLNQSLYKDLNLSFTKQFNDNKQIESVIDSIKDSKGELSVERVQKVFQRIAIRSLMSSLTAPEFDKETGNISPDFFNPVEHYLQRISPFEFWTGDIFLKKDGSVCYIIITPRCDFASKSLESLLVCDLVIGAFPDKLNSEGKEKINKALNDNIAGYARFIPPCPLFKGGKIELSKYSMISKNELIQNFDRVISLSEELTNEILGKFGAYFFRSGINPWDKSEVILSIQSSLENSKIS